MKINTENFDINYAEFGEIWDYILHIMDHNNSFLEEKFVNKKEVRIDRDTYEKMMIMNTIYSMVLLITEEEKNSMIRQFDIYEDAINQIEEEICSNKY